MSDSAKKDARSKYPKAIDEKQNKMQKASVLSCKKFTKFAQDPMIRAGCGIFELNIIDGFYGLTLPAIIIYYNMTTEEFEFDVAISFLQQDENLAIQLNTLLKDRVKTFLYSEQQKKLAGRDGEESFNRVFSKESRIVVVLHRNDWAKTPWTKIEETAIRNRGFEFGYDFVTFIPLDKPVNVPAWLPKNRLWVGLERWGVESAASVIESRIQEVGGNIKIETVVDKVLKAQDEIKNSQRRAAILGNSEGLELTHIEFKNLISNFKQQLDEIKSTLTDWPIKIRENQHQGIDIISFGHFLTIKLYPYVSYTPKGPIIFISFWDGEFDESGTKIDLFYEYKEFGPDKLKFDISKHNEYGWSDADNGRNFRLTNKIVETWLNKFFDAVRKHRLEKGY